MMPITSSIDSLPDVCKAYHSMVRRCLQDQHLENSDANRVFYLTIQEGFVPVGETQRRSGVHIERPNAMAGGIARSEKYEHHWGNGLMIERECREDGIYMVSSVADTSRVWPALIEVPDAITDKHGGIECLRHLLETGISLGANELCWFTDRTPHEALPIQALGMAPVYRQFFRLVVGPIGVWYAKHNTPNPLGILPSAAICEHDKFAACK